MNYLKRDYNKYLKKKREGGKFEDVFVERAVGYLDLFDRIKKYIKPKSKILEVGFGTAYLLSLFAKMGCDVYGIDNSKLSLRFAQKLFKEKKVRGNLKLGDGFKIPYKDNCFDLVFNAGVIEHFPVGEQTKFVREMVRVAKKYVLVAVPNNFDKSVFKEFTKTSSYIEGGEDYIPDFKELSKKVGLKIVMLGGSHVIEPENVCTNEMKRFYKKYKLDLPKKEYRRKDIQVLLKIVKKLPNSVLYKKGFLKYMFAEKIK